MLAARVPGRVLKHGYIIAQPNLKRSCHEECGFVDASGSGLSGQVPGGSGAKRAKAIWQATPSLRSNAGCYVFSTGSVGLERLCFKMEFCEQCPQRLACLQAGF